MKIRTLALRAVALAPYPVVLPFWLPGIWHNRWRWVSKQAPLHVQVQETWNEIKPWDSGGK